MSFQNKKKVYGILINNKTLINLIKSESIAKSLPVNMENESIYWDQLKKLCKKVSNIYTYIYIYIYVCIYIYIYVYIIYMYI